VIAFPSELVREGQKRKFLEGGGTGTLAAIAAPEEQKRASNPDDCGGRHKKNSYRGVDYTRQREN